MLNIGSGDNGELTLLDILSILSFCVGLRNLDLNIAQEDLDKQTQELDGRLHRVVADIHEHLQKQDIKLQKILEVLGNETDGNLQ